MDGLKRYLLVLLLAMTVATAACGKDEATGDGTSSPPNTPPVTGATAKEKIAALENSGAIPKLDRTDTIAGIDSNANGIRDDIEAYIATHYSNPAQRAAAQQFAATLQAAMLVDKTDLAAAKAISLRSGRAVHCLYVKFKVASGDKHPAAVGQEIESISTNTKSRLLAYLAYAKALDGTVGAIPEGDTCE